MKQRVNNPFITNGYLSAYYFCDREAESKELINTIINGNNIALISTRRMGKTGLIEHCFSSKELSNNYYTFFVDIYATRTLRDFILVLSKSILEQLKPFGKKVLDNFIHSIKSIQSGISYDVAGNPSFNLQLGEIQNGEITLEEIFKYLSLADKPSIIAIDEFQQIASYPEKNIEALLRTHIQHCSNAKFIFSGSRQHIMGNMFLSSSRPFYQSVNIINLGSIDINKYTSFAISHFNKANKGITANTISYIYNEFNGITWYMQRVLNTLFSATPEHEVCDIIDADMAIESIIKSYEYIYQEILYRLPDKQKELIIAISKSNYAKELTSSQFTKSNNLLSASSVQSALKGLIEKDFLTKKDEYYMVYDRFFNLWLRKTY